MDNLIAQIDATFAKAPQLPASFKELIVQFAPYLMILSALSMVPMIFLLFGLGTFFSSFGVFGVGSAYGAGNSFMSLAFLAVVWVLYIMAIPGLFSRTQGAWRLLFYASLVNAVSQAISMSLFGLVVGLAIGWYFLFQIRPYYTA